MPMAHRLMDALDSAFFGYTQEEFEKDIIEIEIFSDHEASLLAIGKEGSAWN